jgi:hypothetical protein
MKKTTLVSLVRARTRALLPVALAAVSWFGTTGAFLPQAQAACPGDKKPSVSCPGDKKPSACPDGKKPSAESL